MCVINVCDKQKGKEAMGNILRDRSFAWDMFFRNEKCVFLNKAKKMGSYLKWVFAAR